MGRTRTWNACLTCRQRHLKCDEQLPTCARCRKADLLCRHGFNFSFRNIINEAPRSPGRAHSPLRRSQAAKKSARKMSDLGRETLRAETIFVDETNSIINAHIEAPLHGQTPTRNHGRESNSDIAVPVEDETILTPSSTIPEGTNWVGAIQSWSASNSFIDSPLICEPPLAVAMGDFSDDQNAWDITTTRLEDAHFPVPLLLESDLLLPSPIHTLHEGWTPSGSTVERPNADHSRFSSTSDVSEAIHTEPRRRDQVQELPCFGAEAILCAREAHLVKMFTQTWGPMIDCVDSDRHFTTTIVQLALTRFPFLLNSMMAIAALKLSRVSDYPAAAAEHYRDQCTRSLTSVLLGVENTDIIEEALFANYVLLRAYDHMLGPDRLKKNPQSLFTPVSNISMTPFDARMNQSALKQAVFWAHQLQDIHVALLFQCPIRTDSSSQKEESIQEVLYNRQGRVYSQAVVDCAWANCMVRLLCDIINYCFGEDERTVDAWTTFLSKVGRWNAQKPTTFRPYCQRPRSLKQKRVFPEIWLASDHHVVALVYHHTARLLLESYKPGPRTSFSVRRLALDCNLECREEILVHAREICGILITNPIAEALVIACHLLNVSAAFFTDKEEQEECIRLLRTAEETTGHPATFTIQNLREIWASYEGYWRERDSARY